MKKEEFDKEVNNFVEGILNKTNREELNKILDEKLEELTELISKKVNNEEPKLLTELSYYDDLKKKIEYIAFDEDNHCIMLVTDNGTIANGSPDMLLSCLAVCVRQLKRNGIPKDLIEHAVKLGFTNDFED